MANLKIPVEGKVDVGFTDEAKDLLKKFVKATEKACNQIIWHEIKKEGLPPHHKKGEYEEYLITVCYAETREQQEKGIYSTSITTSGHYDEALGWVRDWQEYVRVIDYEYAEVTHWAEMPKPAVKFSE